MPVTSSFPSTTAVEPKVASPVTEKSFLAVKGASSSNIALPPISAFFAMLTIPLKVPFPSILSVSSKTALSLNSAFPDITLNAPTA